MSGHVFVAQSDLTMLCCDAWLLPTDGTSEVTSTWHPAAEASGIDSFPTRGVRNRWLRRESRTLPIEPFWKAQGNAPAPVPILTDVGGHEKQDLRWYIDGVREFIGAAVRLVPKSSPWRKKPLLAVPLVGTGKGGQNMKKGAMETILLEVLNSEARTQNIDLALILYSDADYAAAQVARRRYGFADVELSSAEKTLLNELASDAKAGHLVLFAGAGLSKSAGLPLWKDLLLKLAADADVSEEESKALLQLPFIDAAAILEKRLYAKGRDLRKLAIEATTASCFGLGHALLAALPIRERVTTNYDGLIEKSLAAIRRPAAVLPYDPSSVGNGWLLKLHGSTSHVETDIVLTRQDYLRYDGRRGALYGIVQALLLTRRMLFVGFSLEDDNFHALVDEVRRAVEGPQRTRAVKSPFGTAFVPRDSTLKKELWGDELRIEELAELSEYPRKLEIALDYLGCMAASHLSHLFDPSFNDILEPDEVRLRDAVRAMKTQLGDTTGSTFDSTRRFFHDLGVYSSGDP